MNDLLYDWWQDVWLNLLHDNLLYDEWSIVWLMTRCMIKFIAWWCDEWYNKVWTMHRTTINPMVTWIGYRFAHDSLRNRFAPDSLEHCFAPYSQWLFVDKNIKLWLTIRPVIKFIVWWKMKDDKIYDKIYDPDLWWRFIVCWW